MSAKRLVKFMLNAADVEALDTYCDERGASRATVLRGLVLGLLRGPKMGPKRAQGSVGGVGGGVSRNIELQGNSVNLLPSKESQNLAKRAQKKGPKTGPPTWLSPYAAAWVARFGAPPKWGLLARQLRPLHDEHGAEKTLRHWKHFLQRSTAEHVNPERFKVTFGVWATADPDAWKHDQTLPRPGESVDAMIARLADAGY